jgi:hypothetical protein
MKRAAAGRFRGSVAHPAACWEQDTIPCADAQGGPESSPAPNGNRMQPGRCATLCDISSRWSGFHPATVVAALRGRL